MITGFISQQDTYTMLRQTVLTVSLLFLATLCEAGAMSGFVYTRSVFVNENGNLTWVEYDPGTGERVNDVAIATGEWDPAQWRVMSALEFNSYVELYNNLRTQYPDLGAPISREEYESQDFVQADGVTPVEKPPLRQGTAYVSILPQSARLPFTGDSFVLGEYAVDVNASGVTSNILSMLVKYAGTDMGSIKATTNNRLGFKTAFVLDEDGQPIDVPEQAYETGFRLDRTAGQSILGPVPGARMEMAFSASSISLNDGFYELYWPSIPCPLEYYGIDSHVTAWLQYRSFNPKARLGVGPYVLMKPIVETCVPQTVIVPFVGPFPIGPGEVQTQPLNTNFPVDVMVLSGTAQLSSSVATEGDRVFLFNGQLPVTQTPTQYAASEPNNEPGAITGHDFDRDGTVDTVVVGHYQTNDAGERTFVPGVDNVPADEQYQGVWLSSSANDPSDTPPDLTRVMDSASFVNFDHEGLLSSISEDDMRNTDIYVVRVSDGRLISERLGLNEEEGRYVTDLGQDEENDLFFYTMQMRNSFGDAFRRVGGGYRFFGRDFDIWQHESGINPDLHARQSDHLQPGDLIRIYAINRATGYVGHTETLIQPAGNGLGIGDLSFHIDSIVMGPPNLSVKVVRDYNISHGLSTGQVRQDQIIGYEGASLTDDTFVKIITDWRDHSGRPMPSALQGAGYTGRMAILSGDKTLPDSDQGVFQFSVEPGENLQVLQLPSSIVSDAQHYYVHINGEPESGNPIFTDTTNTRQRSADFSSSGQNPGVLENRPDNYVPFLVRVFNEGATALQQQAYDEIRRNDPDLAATIDKPSPVYTWLYRPEMQFTSYKFGVDNLWRADQNEDGSLADRVDLLVGNTPVITPENILDVIYDLDTTNLLPLDFLNAGEEKELILALGEQEIALNIGDDQTVRFDNLEHLASLETDDFLTMRLYANNDAGNVLWEWAFGTGLEGQSDVRVVSVDDNTIDLAAYVPLEIDENDLRNIKVRWSVDGGGTLASQITDSQYGLFNNTLTTTQVAGTNHTVTATVIQSLDPRVSVGATRVFGPFYVAPGAARTVQLTSESSTVLNSGQDETTITGRVVDQYNNPVDAGTPVNWDIGYSGSLENSSTEVDENGIVSVQYRSGIETLPTDITLWAGEHSASVQIEKDELDFTLSLSQSSFVAGEQGRVTVNLTEAPEQPIEVFWNNSHGQVNGPVVIDGTSADAVFNVGDLRSNEGVITVNVGGLRKEVEFDVAVANEPGSISFEFSAIAGGTADSYDVETLDGMIGQSVVRTTNATVYGNPGETVTLSAGGLYSQNYQPLAIFPMSGFDQTADNEPAVIDTIGGLEAVVQGDVFWDETQSYLQPGTSMRFAGGELLVSDDDTLDYNTDYYANVRFNPTSLQPGAVLLRKGSNASSGYALTLVDVDGELRVQGRVSTDQGDFTVTSTEALVADTWYLAGIQLKNGRLTLGVNERRFFAAAPGTPNNDGFAHHLRIGENYVGYIDDIKLGQIDISAGSLVLIDGEVEKDITFDSNGQASVMISGGTADLNNLGSRVGFSFVTQDNTAYREEKELKYYTALSRFTLLGNPITQAHAQTSGQANNLEGGVAVVDGQAMAEAIDMLKRAGKPALDAIKTAAKFLFEMTSLSDVWQLTKAVYLWTHGRFDEVDKIELAFAGIGLTLTIVTVAVSIGTAGVGAPGSLAAMVSVKAALRVLKGTLKEVFRQEPAQLLRIGGSVARWAFDLVKNILSGSEGRQAAIQQLTDFKDVFTDLIVNGSTAAWNLLKSIGKSTYGIKVFIDLRRLSRVPCTVTMRPNDNRYLYARLTPLQALSPSSAYAAPLCGGTIGQSVTDAISRHNLTDPQQAQLSSIAARLFPQANNYANAIRVSDETVDAMAEMVSRGQGEKIEKLLDNMADTSLSNMRGFRFDTMKQPLDQAGTTPFDLLIDAMKHIPASDTDAYAKAFNQLAARNASNIRGVYGEAATFKRLKSEELARGSGLRADPSQLRVGRNVYYKGRANVQGVDIEAVLGGGQLVDRSLRTETVTGRPLFVEVKNYTTSYTIKSLKKQTAKHFEANIAGVVGPSGNWERGNKPHLHYEWMGESFVRSDGTLKTAVFNRRRNAVIAQCRTMVRTLPQFRNVDPSFDCETDITFNVVRDFTRPLTARAN